MTRFSSTSLILIIVVSTFALGVMAGTLFHHTYREDAEWELIASEEPEETCTFIEGEIVTVGVGM